MQSTALSKKDKMVGLDVKYEGKKAWFYCSRCSYKNDRRYHAKMHFLRIHVNGGNSCESKQKYKKRVPSVVEFFRQTLRKKTPEKIVEKTPEKIVEKTPEKIVKKTGFVTKMVFGDFDIVTTRVDEAADKEVNLFDFM